MAQPGHISISGIVQDSSNSGQTIIYMKNQVTMAVVTYKFCLSAKKNEVTLIDWRFDGLLTWVLIKLAHCREKSIFH
jgi:hypothetical protein